MQENPVRGSPFEGSRSPEAGRAPPDTPARRSRSLLVWSLTLAGVCLIGASLALAAVGLPAPAYPGLAPLSVIPLSVLLLGGLICARQPQHRLGRILLGLGLAVSVQLASGEYATYSVLSRSGRLFATGAAGWLSSVAQVFTVVGLVVIILLFPTGRLLSHRWRPVAWAVGAGLVGGVIAVAFSGPRFNSNLDFVRNPLYVAHPPLILRALELVGLPAALLGITGAIAQLVARFRRSRGEERQQLKWFAYAGIIAPLITLTLSSTPLGNVVWILGPLSLVAAVGIAIFKYRLYDIDVVINKTLVYALLAAFITAVYVAIVVGIGQAVGSKRNLGLSILATAVVAVGFQPVRDRVQHFANRLVYGKRATPYEVLSEFSGRMSGAYATEDLLPRMARILGEGTGAAQAEVWIRVASELRPGASWPTEPSPHSAISMANGDLPSIDGVDQALPIRHQGELLGALSVTKARGDPLRPAEEKLMGDLASGAGLVLRNVRLTEELLERLKELQASRQRIVAAQDEERRKLERNLHDGAQQQLVALQVKLSLAERIAEEDCRVKDQLGGLKQEATEALENLRDLARGIYPPLLADQGLAAALASQARKAPLPVTVQAEHLSRYPQEQEAAVYFCCLEALQNVAKYSGATHAVIRVFEEDGSLDFTVTDDGAGFDPTATSYGTGLQGMADLKGSKTRSGGESPGQRVGRSF